MAHCLKHSSCISFADDTNVFLTGSNLKLLYSKLLYSKANLELKNTDNWIITNKLSKNIQKTVHILFKTATPSNKPVGSLTLTL